MHFTETLVSHGKTDRGVPGLGSCCTARAKAQGHLTAQRATPGCSLLRAAFSKALCSGCSLPLWQARAAPPSPPAGSEGASHGAAPGGAAHLIPAGLRRGAAGGLRPHGDWVLDSGYLKLLTFFFWNLPNAWPNASTSFEIMRQSRSLEAPDFAPPEPTISSGIDFPYYFRHAMLLKIKVWYLFGCDFFLFLSNFPPAFSLSFSCCC